MLTRRSQFLCQISSLAELVENLGASFSWVFEELQDGSVEDPERYWVLLNGTHYDLNTCLREAVVLFKCFLQALPDKQLGEFQATLQHESQPARNTSYRVPSLTGNLAHRRLAPVKRQ